MDTKGQDLTYSFTLSFDFLLLHITYMDTKGQDLTYSFTLTIILNVVCRLSEISDDLHGSVAMGSLDDPTLLCHPRGPDVWDWLQSVPITTDN